MFRYPQSVEEGNRYPGYRGTGNYDTANFDSGSWTWSSLKAVHFAIESCLQHWLLVFLHPHVFLLKLGWVLMSVIEDMKLKYWLVGSSKKNLCYNWSYSNWSSNNFPDISRKSDTCCIKKPSEFDWVVWVLFGVQYIVLRSQNSMFLTNFQVTLIFLINTVCTSHSPWSTQRRLFQFENTGQYSLLARQILVTNEKLTALHITCFNRTWLSLLRCSSPNSAPV